MRAFIVLAIIGLFCACSSRPVGVLKGAETALKDAELAKKCAPDEYAAAERKYAEAQKLAEKGENDKAAAAGRAAKKLAITAREKALARKDECLNPKTEETRAEDYAEKEPGTQVPTGDSAGMRTVYFGFNTHELDEGARETVDHNAKWLRDNADRTAMVQGHCDARGSTEYNLALGERRAQTARNYLIKLGISGDRIGIVSYGEEQLEDYGESGEAHARNRRAEFRTEL